MPEEAVQQIVMTPYEIIATVLAVIALIQPWFITVWKKFFIPLKVIFSPSAKIKLYYNRSGAYIYLGGVIEAKIDPLLLKIFQPKSFAKAIKRSWHLIGHLS